MPLSQTAPSLSKIACCRTFRLPEAVHDGGWKRPADAAESSGWVLLGDPGAGKTTAFEDLIPEPDREVPPLPGEPSTLGLTGDELDSRAALNERLCAYLDELPSKADSSGSAPGELLVAID